MGGGEKHQHHHHQQHRLPSFHLGHGHEKKDAMPPKGCMAVRVGQEGEEQKKFFVPVVYLNHPLFSRLLKEAEEEYGFDQKGAITLPCRVDDFRLVQDAIQRETGAAHHHHHHSQHHHHHSLPLAGCFRS